MNFVKMAHQAMRFVWRITKPVTKGARVMIIREGKVLLVKHAYQNQYFLPGGMVKKGETFEQAARRELLEEVGMEITELKLFGEYTNFYEHKKDTIVVFLAETGHVKSVRDIEIEAFDFFPLDKLPTNVSPGTRRRIAEYLKGSGMNNGAW
jgi:8-oxo-dGTP pyrophosphatase MutT (NUDIX family)